MKNVISRRPFIMAFVAGAFVCATLGPAAALELDPARAQGLIGERPDGLVGPVSAAPPADVAALVQSINAARMESYRAIAQKNGTPLDAVQKIAGEKQVEKAKENKWFRMTTAGTWEK